MIPGIDFDNPSVIRTVLISEGRNFYRVEVRRGRGDIIRSHPKLVRGFKKAFALGETMQHEARKAYEI